MDCFNVVSRVARFAGIADWLHGCSHRRTSFPITLLTSAGADGRQSTQSETYLVCLECGRHFAYDWSAMRILKQPRGWSRKPSCGLDATEPPYEQRF